MDFVENGDIVTIEYSIKYTNGTIYDSNIGKEPLKFKIGEKIFIKGFEKMILGMSIGEVKTLTLKPEDAFGPKLEEFIKPISREHIPPHINTEIGAKIEIQVPDYLPIRATIIEATKTHIVIDANWKMAGEEFVAMVKLLDIEVEEA